MWDERVIGAVLFFALIAVGLAMVVSANLNGRAYSPAVVYNEDRGY